MATFQSFRSAFNGFNRQDVVQYIEYTNNKHASEVNQLTNDMQALQAELNEAKAQLAKDPDLSAQLDAALAAKAAAETEAEALRLELAKLKERMNAAAACNELEAYRRAERAERKAGERVSTLYQQANGALADATARTEEVSNQISEIADRVADQLAELNSALGQSKLIMRSAASTMYAIRPLSDEE